jgi:hypothetical protein
MKHHSLKVLVPGLFAAAALALAIGAGAQTPPATGHHKHGAATAGHEADMKAECEAMMAKKQELQDKIQGMDADMDKLVAQMNAAQGSKDVDALEKPMAAVINELVAQRKAFRSLMMDMQPAMMDHMMHHMNSQGTKGAMECPMMKKTNASSESRVEEKTPTM